mgnify:CR=1 FL=1
MKSGNLTSSACADKITHQVSRAFDLKLGGMHVSFDKLHSRIGL